MDKKKPNGDADLAEALLKELGESDPADALVFDEQGNPVSKLAKRRASESE